MPLRPVQGDWRKKARAIDYVGAFLSLASSALVILGLTWAGEEYRWTSAHVLCPLLLGVALGAVFVLWQWRGVRVPLMPLHIFRQPIVCAVCLTMSINGWLFLSQVFYLPQFFQLAFRFSAVKSGALLLPVTLAQTLTSTLSGLLIKWGGRYRECILSGWAIWAVGLGLFATVDERTMLANLVGYGVLTGVGVGLTLQPALIAVQCAVDRAQMAVVTSTRNFVRNLGGSVGLALSATIVLNTLRAKLRNAAELSGLDVDEIVRDPASAVLEQQQSPVRLSAEQRDVVVKAYADGFKVVFIVLSCLAALSFVTALAFIPQVSIDRSDDEKLKEVAEQEMREEKEKRRARRVRGNEALQTA